MILSELRAEWAPNVTRDLLAGMAGCAMTGQPVSLPVTHPKSSSVVMLAALAVAVATHDLARGAPVEVIGVNEAGQALVDRLTLHDKPAATLMAGGD